MTASSSRLVVGTDFSETAAVAIDRAVELAQRLGAELIVVHALSPQPVAMAIPSHIMLPPSLDAEIRKASTTRLERIAGEISGTGVRVRTELITGSPGQSIVDLADEVDAGLLVVGTRGLSGLEHLLLGSTAETVVRRASCPVLAVHPVDGAPLSDVGKVLVPCELDEDPTAMVEQLTVGLALEPASTRLVLLYSDHLPFYLQPLIEDLGIDRVGFDEIEDDLKSRLEPTAARLREKGFTVETCVREGDPTGVIIDTARREGADLIAMETRGRSGLAHFFLGSTAERVVQHASCPVLTVHRPAE
ncbi:MAG: universal stress protein [Deltaproteobacteria bacterium]|nr:universal stress protein [Deltaproteobacteria bacterium]